MYVTMLLDKRTNVLLEQEVYKYLAILAEKESVSVGELIRKAIKDVYLTEKDRINLEKQEAINMILELQKGIKIVKKIDYKELIENDRRY